MNCTNRLDAFANRLSGAVVTAQLQAFSNARFAASVCTLDIRCNREPQPEVHHPNLIIHASLTLIELVDAYLADDGVTNGVQCANRSRPLGGLLDLLAQAKNRCVKVSRRIRFLHANVCAEAPAIHAALASLRENLKHPQFHGRQLSSKAIGAL